MLDLLNNLSQQPKTLIDETENNYKRDVEIVDLIINKIISLEKETEFSMEELLGMSLKTEYAQKIATVAIDKACAMGLVKPMYTGRVGLPFLVPYIRI